MNETTTNDDDEEVSDCVPVSEQLECTPLYSTIN